jgi:beta-glucosidase-like glycosyl hydrolase
MSTTTAFKTQDYKGKPKVLRFMTQQYVTGLYVAIYTEGEPTPQQTGSDMKEVDFHRDLRKKIKKEGDVFLKEQSDPLNLHEVNEERIAFAKAYCKRKGWKLSKTPNRAFELLTKRQANAIGNSDGYKALEKKLVWE